MGTNDENKRQDRHGKGRFDTALQRCLDDARQWLQPAPFRIQEPLSTQDDPSNTPAVNRDVSAGLSRQDGTEIDPNQLLQTLAVVATALWRARAKMDAEVVAAIPQELRHIPRHIQAAWDALAANHIEVQDLTGQRYVPGMAVNPITFQPLNGIGTEIIHETIKPSVFYKDTLIQRADVIVGRPIEGDVDGKPHDLPTTTPVDGSKAPTDGDDPSAAPGEAL